MFLPADYEPPSQNEGKYTKFPQGKTTLRIIGDSSLDTAIFGWLGWSDEDGKRQPHRSPVKFPTGKFVEKPKHFWAFLVWNHDVKSVQVCELTQRSIQDALRELLTDEDWGNLKDYDVVIQRDGEGLDTSYNVIPKPKAPLGDETVATIRAIVPDVNIGALFDGDDPFEGKRNAVEEGSDPFQ